MGLSLCAEHPQLDTCALLKGSSPAVARRFPPARPRAAFEAVQADVTLSRLACRSLFMEQAVVPREEGNAHKSSSQLAAAFPDIKCVRMQSLWLFADR